MMRFLFLLCTVCVAHAFDARSFEWDAGNRLIAIAQGASRSEFTRDGFGRCVRILEKKVEKNSGAVVVSEKRFLWDGADIIEERDADGATTKRYFDGGVVIGSQKFFYVRDSLGSITEMLDEQGAVRARYSYDPYGKQTKISGDLDADFGFTGFYRHQASGLWLAMLRAYDPETGRWLSRDPIAESGGLNLYAYVGNNPIMRTDPLGLSWFGILLQVAKMVPLSPTFISAAAGLGDGIFLGLTKKIRDALPSLFGSVDTSCAAYKNAWLAGAATTGLVGGAAIGALINSYAIPEIVYYTAGYGSLLPYLKGQFTIPASNGWFGRGVYATGWMNTNASNFYWRIQNRVDSIEGRIAFIHIRTEGRDVRLTPIPGVFRIVGNVTPTIGEAMTRK